MAGFRFIKNPLVESLVAHSPGVRLVQEAKGRKGAQEAKAIAPVASGAYRDSIEGRVEATPQGWTVFLVAGTDHGAYVELGTEDTPTFAVLRRTLETLA